MRFRKPYTLIRRRGVKGNRVFYYRVRHPETGSRLEYSTHQKSRQAAEHFCELLRLEGRLVPSVSPRNSDLPQNVPIAVLPGSYHDTTGPSSRPALSFGQFAEHWWGPDCPYCASEARRGKVLSRTYVALCRLRLKNHVLPTFADTLLEDIGVAAIESWMSSIPGGPRVRNTALQTFRTMLEEAVRLDYLRSNPCRKVKKFKEEAKVRQLLTNDELTRLFDEVHWANSGLQLLACLTARWTAMRAGEILGVQVSSVFEEAGSFWILVAVSWDREALKSTKNGKPRVVPVPKELAEMLRALPWKSGFLFSRDNGKSPIEYKDLRGALMKALTASGIPRIEQARRGLGLHAFRHAYNTKLRKVADDTDVRAVVGHVAAQMTEHYTHESPETLSSVSRAVQQLFDEEANRGGK